LNIEIPDLPEKTTPVKIEEKNIPERVESDVVMEVSLRPPLFVATRQVVNDLIQEGSILPDIPTIKIKTFLLGTILYDMKNLTLDAFHIDENQTKVWFAENRIMFEIRDLEISTRGAYSIRYNGMEPEGQVEMRAHLNVIGEYTVFLAEGQELGMKLVKIDTPFRTVHVSGTFNTVD
jgi:hypothetical protein